jgi:phage repressor protein C with HTH and peptisase S24 domain
MTLQHPGPLIRTARKAHTPPISQTELSAAVGVSRSAVNLWENGKFMPTPDNLRKVADALHVHVTDIGGVDLAVGPNDDKIPLSNGRILRHSHTRTIYVYGATAKTSGGTAKGGADLAIGHDIVDRIDLPPRLAARHDLRAYRMPTNSMEPRYLKGELFIVGTIRPPTIGDYVLVTLRNRDEDRRNPPATRDAMVRRLIGQTANRLDLEQYNPPRRHSVNLDSIHAIERLVGVDELF